MIDDLKNLAARFVFESNLIERIEVPIGQIVAQLEGTRTTGHVGALLFFNELAVRRKIISKRDVCSAQKLIIKEQNKLGTEQPIKKHEVGHFRAIKVFIVERDGAGSKIVRICMPPNEIEEATSLLLQDIRIFLEKETIQSARGDQQIQGVIQQIGQFHYQFEMIHPFVDGNGRTGRLLVWYLFRFLDLTPFIFTDHDKRYTYYPAFDSLERMQQYFSNRYGKP